MHSLVLQPDKCPKQDSYKLNPKFIVVGVMGTGRNHSLVVPGVCPHTELIKTWSYPWSPCRGQERTSECYGREDGRERNGNSEAGGIATGGSSHSMPVAYLMARDHQRDSKESVKDRVEQRGGDSMPRYRSEYKQGLGHCEEPQRKGPEAVRHRNLWRRSRREKAISE